MYDHVSLESLNSTQYGPGSAPGHHGYIQQQGQGHSPRQPQFISGQTPPVQGRPHSRSDNRKQQLKPQKHLQNQYIGPSFDQQKAYYNEQQHRSGKEQQRSSSQESSPYLGQLYHQGKQQFNYQEKRSPQQNQHAVSNKIPWQGFQEGAPPTPLFGNSPTNDRIYYDGSGSPQQYNTPQQVNSHAMPNRQGNTSPYGRNHPSMNYYGQNAGVINMNPYGNHRPKSPLSQSSTTIDRRPDMHHQSGGANRGGGLMHHGSSSGGGLYRQNQIPESSYQQQEEAMRQTQEAVVSPLRNQMAGTQGAYHAGHVPPPPPPPMPQSGKRRTIREQWGRLKERGSTLLFRRQQQYRGVAPKLPHSNPIPSYTPAANNFITPRVPQVPHLVTQTIHSQNMMFSPDDPVPSRPHLSTSGAGYPISPSMIPFPYGNTIYEESAPGGIVGDGYHPTAPYDSMNNVTGYPPYPHHSNNPSPFSSYTARSRSSLHRRASMLSKSHIELAGNGEGRYESVSGSGMNLEGLRYSEAPTLYHSSLPNVSAHNRYPPRGTPLHHRDGLSEVSHHSILAAAFPVVPQYATTVSDYFHILKDAILSCLSNRLLRLLIAISLLILIALPLEHALQSTSISLQASESDVTLALLSDYGVEVEAGPSLFQRLLMQHFQTSWPNGFLKNLINKSALTISIAFGDILASTHPSHDVSFQRALSKTSDMLTSVPNKVIYIPGERDLYDPEQIQSLSSDAWRDLRRRRNNVWQWNEQLLKLGILERNLHASNTILRPIFNPAAANRTNIDSPHLLILNTILPEAYVLLQLGQSISDADLQQLEEKGYLSPRRPTLKPLLPLILPNQLICLSYYAPSGLGATLQTWIAKHCALVLYRQNKSHTEQKEQSNTLQQKPQTESQHFHVPSTGFYTDTKSPSISLLTLKKSPQDINVVTEVGPMKARLPLQSSNQEDEVTGQSVQLEHAAKQDKDVTSKDVRQFDWRANFETYALPHPELFLLYLYLIYMLIVLILLILPPCHIYFERMSTPVASPDFINSLSFHQPTTVSIPIKKYRNTTFNRFLQTLRQALSLKIPQRRQTLIQWSVLLLLGTALLLIFYFLHLHTQFHLSLFTLFLAVSLVAINAPWLLQTLFYLTFGLFLLITSWIL